MARPQKHNLDYFPHDNGMRNDRKIKAVRAKFGMDGYAIYCMMLETLAEADQLFIEWDDFTVEMIAGDFGISSEKLKIVVDYFCVVKLMTMGEGIVYCPQLDKRSELVFSKRTLLLGDIRSGNPHFRNGNLNNRSDKPQSKVKKSKEKKSEGTDVADFPLENLPQTPADIARSFFTEPTNHPKEHKRLGAETAAFIAYWTEPSKSGKKQKWELERTWELGRRIGTWLKNADRIKQRNHKPTEEEKMRAMFGDKYIPEDN